MTNPRAIHQVEGLTVMLVTGALFLNRGQDWLLFAGLYFVPDLSYLAFAVGRIPGVFMYNLMHTFVMPAALATYGAVAQNALMFDVALIWAAHIGVDRALGIPLKSTDTRWRAELREIGRGSPARIGG